MIEKYRRILVIGIVILQMLFFAGWYMYESQILSKPIAQITVKTLPYDPRDLISGQYIRLSYDFSDLSKFVNHQQKMVNNDTQDLWVVLHQVNGFYEVNTVLFTKPTDIPAGNIAIKGTKNNYDYKNITYGIEKYFVKEGTKEPNHESLTVKLDVYEDGKVRIAQVFLDDKIWP